MSFWRGAAKSQKANKLGDWNLRWNRQAVARRSCSADCAAPESAAAGEVSAVTAVTRTAEEQVAWALGAARVQPTIVVIEDLHWADP